MGCRRKVIVAGVYWLLFCPTCWTAHDRHRHTAVYFRHLCKRSLLVLAVVAFVFHERILDECMSLVGDWRTEIIISNKRNDSSLRLRQLNTTIFASYDTALAHVADRTRFVVLASVDFGYIDMAVNLFTTSIAPFNISNFLLVCSDESAALVARDRGMASVVVDRHDGNGNRSSVFNTEDFILKSHVKTDVVLTALKRRYTVLLVDLDVVFLKNPIAFVRAQCGNCDIAIQRDITQVNSGFYYVKPTRSAIALFSSALQLGRSQPQLSDQITLNHFFKQMNSSGELRTKILPDDLFPNGRVYFEFGGRMFAGDNPCAECVIIHNNWIVGQPAKKYRLKEHLLWRVDTDGYFSCPNRTYMTYDNPDDFGAISTYNEEYAALRNAFTIAHILNRTLIMPRFHCYMCEMVTGEKPVSHCYAGKFYIIARLDRELPYRESVFLRHPLVPQSVKTSVSPVMTITTGSHSNVTHQNVTYTYIARHAGGATPEEIIDWFGKFSNVSVLRFRSLYGAITRIDRVGQFQRNLSDGLVSASYRQFG